MEGLSSSAERDGGGDALRPSIPRRRYSPPVRPSFWESASFPTEQHTGGAPAARLFGQRREGRRRPFEGIPHMQMEFSGLLRRTQRGEISGSSRVLSISLETREDLVVEPSTASSSRLYEEIKRCGREGGRRGGGERREEDPLEGLSPGISRPNPS